MTPIPEAARKLVREFEGLELEAYQDPAGVWTIGYGHTRTARQGQVIMRVEAEMLLSDDLDRAAAIVDRAIAVPLTENQRAALISFAFNLGTQLLTSTLREKLNSGDVEGAAAEFSRWTKARINGRFVDLPGLVRRRQAERELFSTP